MKRTLCLILSTLLLLSTAVITVSAAPAVVATVNGAVAVSGETVPAVSTFVFTLPNEITQSQLATAVTFEEIRKGYAGSGWAARVLDATVEGKTVTVDFGLGDLAMKSQYRFTFKSPAVSTEETFEFYTNAKSGPYYIYENFDRYPNHERIPAVGTDRTELDSPWWLGIKFYSRSTPAIMRDANGDAYMSLVDGFGEDARESTGSVAFDNNYAPASTSATSNYWGVDKYVAKFEFAIAGNPSSVFDVGCTTIKTDADGVTRLYFKKNNIPYGADGVYGKDNFVNLNYVVASPTDQKVKHTVEYVEQLCPGQEYMRRIFSLKFDGVEIPLPVNAEGYIGYSAYQSSGAYHPIEFSGRKGLYYAFSVTNRFPAASVTSGIQQAAEMNVYSFQYSSLVGVNEITTENSPEFSVNDDITVHFGDKPIAGSGSTLAQEFASQISLIKLDGGVEVPLLAVIDEYDADNNSVTITPAQPLEHNTQYKVVVAARNYKLLGAGAAYEHSFSTGWKKIEASTTTTEATSSNFSPAVSVESVTGAALTYDTILALYKTENGITNQVASATTTQASLGVGETTDISVGTVSDPNPSAGATYFAKVFFVEAGNAIAEPIVIGEAPVAFVSPVAGSVSTMEVETDPNTGRMDIVGKCVGSLPFRSLNVTVTTGSGSSEQVIYNDVLNTGTTGLFAFGFNLNPSIDGSAIPEDYIVNVKPVDQASAITLPVNFNFDSVIPSVTALSVTGQPAYRETLTANYSIFDFVGRANASVVSWKVSPTAGGTYETVATGTDLTMYTIPAEHVGKFLICEVTPKVTLSSGSTSDGVNYAIPTPLYLASKPEATGVAISQASGSNTVQLVYNVSDPFTHDVDVRKVTWTIKDTSGNVVKELADNPSDTYIVAAEDNGKTIQATITPRIKLESCAHGESCQDIATGVDVLSNTITMVYNETDADRVVGSGSSSSGGGGGGGLRAPINNTPQEVLNPDDEATTPNDSGAIAGVLDLVDVRGHWAEKEIFNLYDKGIVNGKGNNAFDPDGQITRAEFVAILVRTMGLETVVFSGDFVDVSNDKWYADILSTAKANGLFEGADGKANPDQAITREEMVQIIVRAYEKLCGEIEVGGGLLNYTDAVNISAWAREAVIKASEIGLVNGVGERIFSPAANTTRAQGAVIIGRLLPFVEVAASAVKAEAIETVTEEIVTEETEATEAIETETSSEVLEAASANAENAPAEEA